MVKKLEGSAIQNYLEDSSGLRGGYAEAVFLPENEEEASAILQGANERRVPVTISGGGTGVVGARVPFGGWVISTEKLDRLIKIDSAHKYAIAQSGVRIEGFKRALDKSGLMYPADPTEQNATLGGAVSTNSSGARSFKYGPTRNFVRRLKVVLADGRLLNIHRGDMTDPPRPPRPPAKLARRARRARSRQNFALQNLAEEFDTQIPISIPAYNMPRTHKHSAGYFAKPGMDLLDLFIGAEGTLGLITEVELALLKKPEAFFSAFAFFKDEAQAVLFAICARDESYSTRSSKGNGIDALSIEYFDSHSLALLRNKYSNLPEWAQACIYFEQELGGTARDDDLVSKWQALLERFGVDMRDVWISMSEKDERRFKEFRHALPSMLTEEIRRRKLTKLSLDLAVPDNMFLEMCKFYKHKLDAGGIEHYVFGHIGSSHLHVNLLPRDESEANKARGLAQDAVRKAISLGGTISAEHGVGKLKHEYLLQLYGERGVREMVRIKRALDPNCILGRGNIFPVSYLL